MINSIECRTSEISRFVDHHLQPVVKEIPSYVKDTNHFIIKVNDFSVPVNSVSFTMDVRSLYTSIPNKEDIAATKKRYENCIHKTLPTKFITTFLALILALKVVLWVQFALRHICMVKFEQKYIYPLIRDLSVDKLFS